MSELEDQLAKVRALVEEAMEICAEMGAPIAANFMHMGLEQLEDVVRPDRLHELPTDLPGSK